MRKVKFVRYFDVLCRCFPGGTEENHADNEAVNIPTEIRTGYILSTRSRNAVTEYGDKEVPSWQNDYGQDVQSLQECNKASTDTAHVRRERRLFLFCKERLLRGLMLLRVTNGIKSD
jgi:hypothetical protein